MAWIDPGEGEITTRSNHERRDAVLHAGVGHHAHGLADGDGNLELQPFALHVLVCENLGVPIRRMNSGGCYLGLLWCWCFVLMDPIKQLTLSGALAGINNQFDQGQLEDATYQFAADVIRLCFEEEVGCPIAAANAREEFLTQDG